MTESEIRRMIIDDEIRSMSSDWHKISRKGVLSAEFIHEFRDKVDWVWICISQKMSMEFIYDHREYISWVNLVINHDLTEEFMRDHIEFIEGYWLYIAQYQPLSEKFILDFIDYLPAQRLLWNDRLKLSDEVKLLLQLEKL
jgi:hypothetical protein